MTAVGDGVPPGAAALDAPVTRDGAPGLAARAYRRRRVHPARLRRSLALSAPVRDARLVADRRRAGRRSAIRTGWPRRATARGPGTCILFRPDQHVAARFARFDPLRIEAALDRALARTPARHDGDRLMPLDTTPRLTDPDALYAALVAAHADLPPEASRRLDAQLVLLLANHIGDARCRARGDPHRARRRPRPTTGGEPQ